MLIDWLAAWAGSRAKSHVSPSRKLKNMRKLHLLFSMLIYYITAGTKSGLWKNKYVISNWIMWYMDILVYLCCRRPTFYCTRQNVVPVGEDQLPHIEITRELASDLMHSMPRFSRNRKGKLQNLHGCPPRWKTDEASLSATQFFFQDSPESIMKKAQDGSDRSTKKFAKAIPVIQIYVSFLPITINLIWRRLQGFELIVKVVSLDAWIAKWIVLKK